MTKSLGQFVGLLLSLYVFDEIVAAVIPNLCTTPATPAGWDAVTYSALNSTTTTTACIWTNGSEAQHTTAAMGGWFGSAVNLITPLFGVVGILAAFEIIYGALRAAKLV